MYQLGYWLSCCNEKTLKYSGQNVFKFNFFHLRVVPGHILEEAFVFLEIRIAMSVINLFSPFSFIGTPPQSIPVITLQCFNYWSLKLIL